MLDPKSMQAFEGFILLGCGGTALRALVLPCAGLAALALKRANMRRMG